MGSSAYWASLFLASASSSRSPWYSTTKSPFWKPLRANTPLPFPSMCLTCKHPEQTNYIPENVEENLKHWHCFDLCAALNLWWRSLSNTWCLFVCKNIDSLNVICYPQAFFNATLDHVIKVSVFFTLLTIWELSQTLFVQDKNEKMPDYNDCFFL